MFVWIPRYSYKIPNTESGYHRANTGTTGGTYCLVDIKFLQGTSSSGTVEYNEETTNTYTQFPDGYVVHPAFDLRDEDDNIVKKLTGIWVAKFEASSSTTTTALDSNSGSSYGRTSNTDNVTIRPNVTSWRNGTVTQFYNACVAMTSNNNNFHGLSASADSHLMKDTEWGVVAYLTQSIYGNPQIDDDTSGVWNNSYQYGDGFYVSSSIYGNYYSQGTTRTGIVGETRDQSASDHAQNLKEVNANNTTAVTQNQVNGTITIQYKTYNQGDTFGNPNPTGDEYTRTFYEYWTEQGQKGSTTRNIYGIYDMAGGAWEYMATFLNVPVPDSGRTTAEDQVYNFNNIPTYHREIYAYSGTAGDAGRQANYEANKDRYGNAVWETSSLGNASNYSWNNDNFNFVYSTYPYVVRGGGYTNTINAGLFNFINLSGGPSRYYTFRPVLWATKVE